MSITFDRYLSMAEIIEKMEAVTPAEVAETAEQMLAKDGFTVVGLGPCRTKWTFEDSPVLSSNQSFA